MTIIRGAFPTALLTALTLSTPAFAQTPATAPAGSKPGAAPAPAPSTARQVVAPGAAVGAPQGIKPVAAPGTSAPAAHQAPVVTNPPGMAPPAKGASTSAPAPGSAGGGSASAAAAPAGPPMPTPNKDMEAFMKPFEGSWRCETKFAAGSMGPGSPEVTTKSTVRIKKEFGGFSWHGEFSLPKSKTMPAMSGVFQIAHDAGSNGATIVGYDSMGSSFMGTGAISGDSVTFTEEGYMMGAKTKIRETMTKAGPKAVVHKYEVDMGKGFQPMGEDNCKR
jgi:hypothetical protein